MSLFGGKPTASVRAIIAIYLTFYRLNPSWKSVSSLKRQKNVKRGHIWAQFVDQKIVSQKFVISLSGSSGPPLKRPIA